MNDLADPFTQLNRVVTACGEIAYRDVGDGPVALLLHGVFLNSYVWRHVVELLAGPHRRCIAIDLLAHGHTETAIGQDLAFPAQADMVVAVLDALDIEEADIVGNDSGGAIAQLVAVRHPTRVRSLVLTNCDVHDNWPPRAFAPVVAMAANGVLGFVAPEMLTNLELARSDLGLGAGLQHPERLTEQIVDAYLAPLFSTPARIAEFERFINAWDCRQTTDIEGLLRTLHTPTLIVWGTADIFFPLDWAYWLQHTIPGARPVIEIPGGRLFLPEEHPVPLAAEFAAHWASSDHQA
jgi:pimeloyl-ACP methyl ester carboxylesterase